MKTKTKVIIGIVIVVVLLVVVLAVLLGSSRSRTDIGYSPSMGMGGSTQNMASYDSNRVDISAPAPIAGIVPGQKEAADYEGKSVGSENINLQQNDRMIIRMGQLSVVTKDVRKSLEEVSSFATSVGGFIVASNVEGTSDNPSATLEIRVPVERFQDAVTKAEKSGVRVISESLNGQDVTEDYVDTQARIKNLQASEAQFVEIMKNAQKITDVLEVQRQLERVRGEIEVAQGRAQYLEKSARLSSITIYFATDVGQLPVVDPVNVWNPLNIIKSAFRVLINVAQGIGTVLIWLIIFIPVWLLIFIVVHIIKKTIKKKASTL